MEKPIHYICRECAEILSGEWSEGHLATSHLGDCDRCGEEAPLCSVRDWNLNERGELEKTTSVEWD